MKPLVSIVIPVYNSERYLEETIASAEQQDYERIEIIIVNNCSDSPDTLQALDKLRAKYKVVDSEKKGLSIARNDGIRSSEGSFILPLDSDDIIAPTFVSECITMFEENPGLTVVRTSVKLFGAKSGILEFAEYSFSLLLARNLMVATSMFKKEDWEKVNGYDPDFKSAFEDWEFWISVLKDGGTVGTIKKPLFHYRIQRDSMMRSTKMEELRKVRKKLWEKHKALYGKYYMDPVDSFEYLYMVESRAHKIGRLLVKPFSGFKLMQ